MRNVKCQICKKLLPQNTAYCIAKVDKNGKTSHKYYCSQDEYDKVMINKLQSENRRKRTHDLINKILGYKCKNTFMFGEEKNWNDHEYKVDAIECHTDYLSSALNTKSFTNEYSKLKYLSTIINNNIKDWYDEIKTEYESRHSESVPVIYDTEERYDLPQKYKPRKRHCLDDYNFQ